MGPVIVSRVLESPEEPDVKEEEESREPGLLHSAPCISLQQCSQVQTFSCDKLQGGITQPWGELPAWWVGESFCMLRGCGQDAE